MNDIYAKRWNKKIQQLIDSSNIDGIESLKRVIHETTGIDDYLKEEFNLKCETAKKQILEKQEELKETELEEDEIIDEVEDVEDSELEDDIELDGEEIDTKDVSVGEDARHVKMSKARIAAIVIGIATIGMVAGATIHSCHSCSSTPKTNNNNNSSNSGSLDNNDEKGNEIDDEIKTIKPTLSFDTEDTDVMIENIDNFLNESLTKGIKLNEETLDNDLESFVDFYIALNIDEIGPGYLGKLYQDDKKSYLDVFNNFTRWAMVITDEAMMSSVKDNNVMDVSLLVANKNEAETLQNAFDLLAQIHDNGLAGNVEALEKNALEFHKLLDETLLLEEGTYHSYSSSFKVMLAYSAMNADLLLQNYENIIIVDDDIRKVMYEDSEIGCAMSLREYRLDGKELTDNEMLLLLDQSEANNSGVSLAYQLEKKYDQMVMIINSVDVDYSDETSISQVLQILKAEIDLSLYKPNQEYTEYNDLTYEINHPTIEVPEDSIVVNDGKNYVEKEELDKHNIDTNDKTAEEIEKEYQEAVKEEVESSLENDKKFEDNKGNVLETGSNAENYALDYSNGYTAGSKQGAIDGNALSAEKSVVTGSDGYVAGYAAGYKEAYNEAKQNRLNAEKETSVTTETIEPIEQSREELESGLLPQEELQTLPLLETTTSVTLEDETTTVKVEEEVIEEGLLTPSGEQVTLSYDELYNIYYEALYGMNSNSLEEETTHSKTR